MQGSYLKTFHVYCAITLTGCASYTAKPLTARGAAAAFDSRNQHSQELLTALKSEGVAMKSRGGVLAAWLNGGVLSLGWLVGFVTVLGSAARNGIMLVSHFRHLEHEEGAPFSRAMILRGAEERLAPILMTAATAGLALLPLVWRGNIPGHEIEYPMAIVILGGLVTSTLLNVFLLPVLYGRFSRRAEFTAVVD